jgi:RNA polymerase sigma-70 factor, ECF subfamily
MGVLDRWWSGSESYRDIRTAWIEVLRNWLPSWTLPWNSQCHPAWNAGSMQMARIHDLAGKIEPMSDSRAIGPMDPEAIDRLVVAAQGGDRIALRRALEAVVPALRLSLAVRVPNFDLAEEMLQETLVTCLRRLGDYRPEGTFAAWLKGIARLHLLERLREQSRYRSSGEAELESVIAAAHLENLEDERREPEPQATPRHLNRCLDRLPARARALLVRRHAEHTPLERLAQQFKQPVSALTSALKRLRRTVRECMERELARDIAEGTA